MAGPVPVEGDREVWCRERLEFVCAVVPDVDRNSFKVQLEQCETEDEAEALLHSLLWLQDFNAGQIEGDLGGATYDPMVVGLEQDHHRDFEIDQEENQRLQQRLEMDQNQEENQRLMQRLEMDQNQEENQRLMQRLEMNQNPEENQRLQQRLEEINQNPDQGQRLYPRLEFELEPEEVQRLQQRLEINQNPEEGQRLQQRLEINQNPEEVQRLQQRLEINQNPKEGQKLQQRLEINQNPEEGQRLQQALLEMNQNKDNFQGILQRIKMNRNKEKLQRIMQRLEVTQRLMNQNPDEEDQRLKQRLEINQNPEHGLRLYPSLDFELEPEEGQRLHQRLEMDHRIIHEVEDQETHAAQDIEKNEYQELLLIMHQDIAEIEDQEEKQELHQRPGLEKQETPEIDDQENLSIVDQEIEETDDQEIGEMYQEREEYENQLERVTEMQEEIMNEDQTEEAEDSENIIDVSDSDALLEDGSEEVKFIDANEVASGGSEEDLIDFSEVASGGSVEGIILQVNSEESGRSGGGSSVDVGGMTDMDNEEFEVIGGTEDASGSSDMGDLFLLDEDKDETEYQESDEEKEEENGEEMPGESQEEEEGEDEYHTPREFADDQEANNEVQELQEVIDEDEQLARRIAEEMAEEERRTLEADERLARIITQEMERQENEQELRDAQFARRLADEIARENGEPNDLAMEREVEAEEGDSEFVVLQADDVLVVGDEGLARAVVDERGRLFDPPQGEMVMDNQEDIGGLERRQVEEPLARVGQQALEDLHARIVGYHEGEMAIEEERDEIIRGQVLMNLAPREYDEMVNDEVIAREMVEEGAVGGCEDTRGDEELARRLEQEKEEDGQRVDEELARRLKQEDEKQNQGIKESLRVDEEIARRLKEEEEERQNQKMEAENVKTRHFADLLTMFPDADPAYLQERCEQQEGFEQVVEQLLELQKVSPRDPRISGHFARRKLESLYATAATTTTDDQEEAVVEEDVIKECQGATGSTTYECTICFEEDVLSKNIATCSGLISCHHFCIECVRKHIGTQIGLGNNSFRCMNGYCEAEFSDPTLSRVMDPQVLKKVQERRATEDVTRAGIQDLVTCPFCCYMVIMPDPRNRVLECRNPECFKDSCRQCREPSHIPLRCEEVERDNQKDARTLLENRMAEAMIRTCLQCNKRFIIESGCNKMTCSCGTIMCYVCKQVITSSYTHFEQNQNVQSNKCPLYSNAQELHSGEVREAAQQARQELDPNITLVHDPMRDLA